MKIYKIAAKYTDFATLSYILDKLWKDKTSPDYQVLKERIKNNHFVGNKHHLVRSIEKRQGVI